MRVHKFPIPLGPFDLYPTQPQTNAPPVTILTSPFYVPNPPLDQSWSGRPLNSIFIATATTGTETTTIFRAPFYARRPDDVAYWTGNPLNSTYLHISTTAQPNPFVPNTWNFDYDDLAVWYRPTKQKSITLISAVATSPVVPGTWNFDNDDSAIWTYQPITIPIVEYFATTIFGSFSPVPRPADDPTWNSAPINSAFIETAIPSTPGESTTIFRAPFYVLRPDDTAFWLKSSVSSKAILSVVAPKPFINVKWNYSDEASLWSGKPTGAAPIPMLTAGGQPHTKQRHYDNDDISVWSLTLQQRDLPLTIVSVAASPLTINRWPFGYDDSSIWNASPKNTPFIVQTIFRSFTFVPRPADDNLWSVSYSSKNIPTIVQPKPFVNVNWNYSDDISSWQWQGSKISYVFTTEQKLFGAAGQVPAKQWHYDNDDSSVWWSWLRRNTVVGTVQVFPSPFIPVPWRFNSDDPPPWQQPSQRSIALPFVPSIVNRWQLVPADDQLWALTARYNPVLGATPFVNRWQLVPADDQLWSLTTHKTIVTQVPPIQNRWRLDLADDQIWTFTAHRTITIVAPFSSRPYVSTIDEAIWQSQTQQLNRVFLTKKPVVPVFWPFNYDDSAYSWRQATQRSKSISAAPQFPPFTLRQSSFFNDDYSVWKWQPPNIIFGLKWDIALERIANTKAENRFVAASSETRFSPTTPEMRTTSTKVEARFANTTKEIRIAIAPDEDETP